MHEPVIEFRQVHKSFGDQCVLAGVDLTIRRGLVTTIIGRSGIGKSVLLKHMVGLLEPDSGDIFYLGKPLAKMRRAERGALRRNCAYMFQNTALFDSMTVYQNIALALEEKSRLRRAEIDERVMARVGQFDLDDITRKYPSQISGGMRKRVALARALITDPEIVLFDEPTTGLDPVRKAAVHRMIAHYQEAFGFTAVIVSHDIPDVFDISQEVAMLDGGRIIFDGSPEEVHASQDPAVQRFIHGEENLEQAV